jgi:hypothetical protein
MKPKKFIFFVTTFGSIYQRVLPLIEEKKEYGDIKVVVTTEQIELFFKNFTDFQVIRTKIHPDLIGKKTWYKLFFNLFRSKLEYQKLFRGVEDAEIYFFGTASAIVIYSYIQKLSKNNVVYLCLCEPSNLKETVKTGIISTLMNFFTKIFLNLDTEILTLGSSRFYSLDKIFFDKNHITIISDYKPNYRLLDRYMTKLDVMNGKKILFAMEDLIACDHVEETEFITKLDAAVEILNEYYPELCVVKPHPRLKKIYGKMASFPVISEYIPSEFLLKHAWEFVIGIESTSLISAAKQTNACVISLINLFTYKSAESQNNWRNYLQGDIENKIHLPKDLLEFRQLLKKEL